METFLKGLAMGFCIAAPVGPVGLLCIRRSMTEGRMYGFVSGLGAATADAFYGPVAALGLSAVTALLLAHRTPIQAFGGAFLIVLGVRILRQPPVTTPATGAEKPDRNLLAAYASILGLTLTNPATVLAFLGIFAGLGIGVKTTGVLAPCLLVAGVFLGSSAWWLFLSNASHWLGGKAGARHLRWVNTISGVAIVGFGAWQLISLL